MGTPKSRRQELGRFASTGDLRQAVEGKLSADAIDLLVEVVMRYCEPRTGHSARSYLAALRRAQAEK